MRVTEGLNLYDIVFVGSTSVPGYKLVDNPTYPAIAADYARTFRILMQLPCDVFLASHGSFFSMQEKAERKARQPKANPFIDPSGYRSFVAQTEKAFAAKLRAQKQTKVSGRK